MRSRWPSGAGRSSLLNLFLGTRRDKQYCLPAARLLGDVRDRHLD
jgi:hypothetical protein